MKTKFAAAAKPRQTGLTLVEIMVAMLLSLVLLGGVVQIFISSKSTYNAQEGLSRMQENGRFAVEFLARELRMAGHFGCLSDVKGFVHSLNSDDLPTAASFNPGEGIVGWDASNTGNGDTLALDITAAPAPTDGAGWSSSSTTAMESGINAMPGSDIIRVWRAGDDPVEIVNVPGTKGANTVINASRTTQFEDNDLILITDCARAELIQACNVQDTTSGGVAVTNLVLSGGCSPGNDVPNSLQVKAPPGEAAMITSTLFYIGKQGDNAANPPALFKRELLNTGALGPAQELVRGVETMQVFYGEDTGNDGSADRYVDATVVGSTNWNRIVSVRVAVLASSVEETLPETNIQTYDLLGVTVDPVDDRRMRQVFVSTIALRNRTMQ